MLCGGVAACARAGVELSWAHDAVGDDFPVTGMCVVIVLCVCV